MIFVNVYQGTSNQRAGKPKYQWTFPEGTEAKAIATELYNKESKTVGAQMGTQGNPAKPQEIFAHIEHIVRLALKGGASANIAGLVIQVTHD
ncbi:hypothetical protein [Mycobacteroides franklinii]|uniref:hypothetical protein n=1 Tax=Mycobacteroides franklinii TaxID=948102 RepID=UPI0009919CF3|nr:hypothetical protein [Mycobacteroides franklinii]